MSYSLSQAHDNTPEDERILDLYFARDERAIAETDRRYGRLCMKVSLDILGPGCTPDAEECVSDTYLKAWNSIPPKRPQSLCAYVCRIVRNLSINRLRDLTAGRRNRELTVSLSELEACTPAEESVSHEELGRAISDFLRTLDERDRHLFMERYWYTRSIQELSDTHHMRPDAVSRRLYKLRERLRTHLAERGYTV